MQCTTMTFSSKITPHIDAFIELISQVFFPVKIVFLWDAILNFLCHCFSGDRSHSHESVYFYLILAHF